MIRCTATTAQASAIRSKSRWSNTVSFFPHMGLQRRGISLLFTHLNPLAEGLLALS
jgi:hypothetical protein